MLLCRIRRFLLQFLKYVRNWHIYKIFGPIVDIKKHVIRSCRYLLRPVVRFLLRHGVTLHEFVDLSKEAYVAVARADYGIQGRPTNNARVAMLTGLSRREVAKVRDRLLDNANVDRDSQGNRISQILTAWHVDEEFCDAQGRPKVLPGSGPSESLSSLLKRYAGDLPHGAIRKEMQQRQLIEEVNDGNYRVLKRDYVYTEIDPEIVGRMGVALHDHAATLEHNLNEQRRSAPRFEAIADNSRVRPASYQAFQKLVAEQGLSFLEAMDDWLSENEVDSSSDTDANTVRLGVGVYLIYDEGQEGLEP